MTWQLVAVVAWVVCGLLVVLVFGPMRPEP